MFYCPTRSTKIVESMAAKFLEADVADIDFILHVDDSNHCEIVFIPLPPLVTSEAPISGGG